MNTADFFFKGLANFIFTAHRRDPNSKPSSSNHAASFSSRRGVISSDGKSFVRKHKPSKTASTAARGKGFPPRIPTARSPRAPESDRVDYSRPASIRSSQLGGTRGQGPIEGSGKPKPAAGEGHSGVRTRPIPPLVPEPVQITSSGPALNRPRRHTVQAPLQGPTANLPPPRLQPPYRDPAHHRDPSPPPRLPSTHRRDPSPIPPSPSDKHFFTNHHPFLDPSRRPEKQRPLRHSIIGAVFGPQLPPGAANARRQVIFPS